MKKILTITAIALISQQAYAVDSGKTYLRVGAIGGIAQTVNYKHTKGPLEIEHKGEVSFGGLASIGYRLADNISIELGVDYLHNKYKSKVRSGQVNPEIKLKIINPKISIYYNHNLTENMDLYIGGGAGASIASSHATTDKANPGSDLNRDQKDKTSFACSLDVGFLFNFNKAAFDLGYSFGYYGKPHNFNVMIHSARAGIRYNF